MSFKKSKLLFPLVVGGLISTSCFAISSLKSISNQNNSVVSFVKNESSKQDKVDVVDAFKQYYVKTVKLFSDKSLNFSEMWAKFKKLFVEMSDKGCFTFSSLNFIFNQPLNDDELKLFGFNNQQEYENVKKSFEQFLDKMAKIVYGLNSTNVDEKMAKLNEFFGELDKNTLKIYDDLAHYSCVKTTGVSVKL